MATRDSDTERWVDDRLEVLAPPAGWEPHQARGLTAVRGRLDSSARARRWTTFVPAAVVVTVLVLGMPALKGFAHACGEFVRRNLSGGSATHTNLAARSLPAPDAFPVVDGRPFAASEYRGKVVLLSYQPENCSQCSTEAEWFREFDSIYGARGFVVIRARASADDLARERVRTSFPTAWLFDRAGRVAVRHTGYCSKTEFESDIQTLLDEQ